MITELNESGQKERTFVYQGGQILAWQQQSGSTQTVSWEHRDVSNASVRGAAVAELEPLGMNAGVRNPFPRTSSRPPLQQARTYPGFADMTSTQCRVDGIDMPCSMVSSETAVPCPDNDCGPRARVVTNPEGEQRSILTLPFMAFNNGVSGFFLAGWAQMGTAQAQADAVAAVMRGGYSTGIDSPDGQGQFANHFLPQDPLKLPNVGVDVYRKSRAEAQRRQVEAERRRRRLAAYDDCLERSLTNPTGFEEDYENILPSWDNVGEAAFQGLGVGTAVGIGVGTKLGPQAGAIAGGGTAITITTGNLLWGVGYRSTKNVVKFFRQHHRIVNERIRRRDECINKFRDVVNPYGLPYRN